MLLERERRHRIPKVSRAAVLVEQDVIKAECKGSVERDSQSLGDLCRKRMSGRVPFRDIVAVHALIVRRPTCGVTDAGTDNEHIGSAEDRSKSTYLFSLVI